MKFPRLKEASEGRSPLHDKPLLKTIVLLRSPGLEVLSAAPVANPSDLADCAGAPKSRPHCSGDLSLQGGGCWRRPRPRMLLIDRRTMTMWLATLDENRVGETWDEYALA